MVFELPFALFLQARNRPVGQSQLANQSARYIGYKPQLEKLPGTLHVPQATQCTLTEGLVCLLFCAINCHLRETEGEDPLNFLDKAHKIQVNCYLIVVIEMSNLSLINKLCTNLQDSFL